MASGMVATLEERFWKKVCVRSFDECWEWLGASQKFGHGHISQGGRGSRTLKAHRVSWELHFGKIPEGLCVCHKCDNPGCVNPMHLFLGTMKENSEDMVRKGRYVRGVPNPRKGEEKSTAKLTDEAVREMRELWASGWKQKDLAARYGIKQSRVSNIVNRKGWAHIL